MAGGVFRQRWRRELARRRRFYLPAGGGDVTIAISKASILVDGRTFVDTLTAPVDKAAIVVAGKTLTDTVSVPFVKGSVTLTGKTFDVYAAISVALDKAAVALTGKALLANAAVPVVKASAIAVAGKTLLANVAVPFVKGAAALTGKTFTVSEGQPPIAIDKAGVAVRGKTFSHPFESAAFASVGGGVGRRVKGGADRSHTDA